MLKISNESQEIMSEWKPIDTAPRDGTYVLGYREGEGWMTVIYWSDYLYKGGNWRALYCEKGDWWPTHWMPLPQPPKKERKKEKGIRDVYKFVVDATEKEIANKKQLKGDTN